MVLIWIKLQNRQRLLKVVNFAEIICKERRTEFAFIFILFFLNFDPRRFYQRVIRKPEKDLIFI